MTVRVAMWSGPRNLSTAMTEVLAAMVRAHGGDADHLEYTADAILGAVALGVLRWLNEPTIDKDELIAQLTPVIWGAVSAAAAARGVVIAPDEQMALFGTAD